MPIRILPETVTSQIAAGEVVERPASVVKELLENALDAGAANIEIRIEKAGRDLIEVADDGSGIPFGELNLAVARHATSKLESAQDLSHIHTLGFRGEALASIASVSILTIQSQTTDSRTGGQVIVKGGKVNGAQEVGGGSGTRVKVEQLFYNTPARLKFLKHDLTEKNQITTLVFRYALEYPKVRFSLNSDSKVIFHTFGNNDRREILSQIFGVEVGRQLLEVDLKDESMSIAGYISPITVTRSNRREMVFFVNGRLVQDATLSTAFLQAYRSLLMVGRYPLGFLSVHLDPEDVDVNVHPSKAEIRFRESDRIFGCVQRAIKRALMSNNMAPAVFQTGWASFNQGWDRANEQNPLPKFVSSPALIHPTGESVRSPDAQPIPLSHMPLLRTIGQIGMAYIVAEGPDGLYLIDQHAAHERVLYEKFTARVPQQVSAQALLEPRVIHLSSNLASLLKEQLSVLLGLGFDIEEFGENSFRIKSIPQFLSGQDVGQLIHSALEQAEEDETPFQNQMDLRLIARICKRAAIKSGIALSLEEARALIQDLEKCNSPRTCPHGRPTMIHLPVDLLERQFGRRGAR
jgi:DNA mismatch repair protein MutL